MINNGELIFLNHASFIFKHNDHYFLTDPWIISPAFGSWLQSPGISEKAFKFIDTIERDRLSIIVSHGHDDHCDDFILNSRFANAQFIIPEYRSKGFLKRIERISSSAVIEVGDSPIDVNGTFLSSYINPNFTHNDAIVFFDTGSSLIVHGNDNWHFQHQSFFDRFNMFQNKNIHYFSQIGIADCFPSHFPQFTNDEYIESVNERVLEAYKQVTKNADVMKAPVVYAYANQSRIYKKVKRDLISNEQAIQRIQKENKTSNVIQMQAGFVLSLQTGELYKDTKCSDGSFFRYALKTLEQSATEFIKNDLDRKKLDISFKLLFEEEGDAQDYSNHDADVVIVLEAGRLLWSRVLSAELNLESIIIGGSGNIYRWPKDYNISVFHQALSVFSYISQSLLKQGKLL